MGTYLQNISGTTNSSPEKRQFAYLANEDFREHSLPLFRQLGNPPLSKHNEYCLGKCMYRQHNHLAPVKIMGDIVYNHNVNNYNTRGLSIIHVQYYRTQRVANSFLNKGQHQWQMIHLIYVGYILSIPLLGGSNTS